MGNLGLPAAQAGFGEVATVRRVLGPAHEVACLGLADLIGQRIDHRVEVFDRKLAPAQLEPAVGVALADVWVVRLRRVGGRPEQVAVPREARVEPGLARHGADRVDDAFPGARFVVAHIFAAEGAVVVPDRAADDLAPAVLVEKRAVPAPIDIHHQQV